MVLPEVARDPPSPFLTVQADDCDGAVLPVVTPPVAAAPAVPRTPPTAAMGPARTSPFAAGGDDGGGGESNSHGSSSNGITSSSSAGGQWQQQHSQQLPRYQAPVGAGAAAGSAAMTSSSGAAMTAPLNSKRGVQPRSNLQSIVSQQSLDFTVPDSPLEFELAAAAAAAGDGGGSGGGGSGGVQQAAKHKQLAEQQVQQQPAAAAGLGHGPASAAVAGAAADTGAQQDLQAGDTWRPRGLRFLPLKQPRLRSCQSLPQQAPQHKQLAALQLGLGNGSATGSQPQMSYNSCSALPGATNQQQQQQQHSALSRRLRSKVNKLLSWASSSGGSRQSHPGAVPAAPRLSPSRLSAAGAVVVETAFVGSSSVQSQQQQQQQQQQQPWPVPWQQQLFADTSPVQARHSLPGVIGVPLSLRSPRTSLVSSPSGCDCPFFHGRYSSAGSDSCGLSPAGPVGRASTSLVSSYSCSAASSPSPGKLLAVSGDGGGGGSGGGMLLTSTSARPAHHRQRLHRPGCRFYYEQQLLAQQAPQQQFLPQQLQQQLAQQGPQLSQNGSLPLAQQAPQQHQPGLPPVSPTFGGVLQSQSSLRTALQQLESMASLKAARIMDKLNAGLLKMTSSTNRVLDGMALKCGVVGKEVMYDWEFGAFLGSGGSCVTRLVIGRDSGRTAACKSISKQGILRSAAVKAALLGVQREVAILQASTGHPHVVQLQAVYEDVHNLHIILEWCAGGHLYSLMERCPGCRLPEHAAAAATKATLEVLAHCHARGVMHRDIKPENLLVCRPVDHAGELTPSLIKVTDFGISLPVEHGKALEELAGTLGYMAPELLQRRYDQQADVWSNGVMLYEMVTGRLPFPTGNTCEECLAGIMGTELDLHCPEWQAASEQGRELVAAMLTKDPALRPTAQKLLHIYRAWLSMGDTPRGPPPPEEEEEQQQPGQQGQWDQPAGLQQQPPVVQMQPPPGGLQAAVLA